MEGIPNSTESDWKSKWFRHHSGSSSTPTSSSPFTVRDTLLRAAEQDLYLIGWSAKILEEMRRNLVKTGHTTERGSHSLVEAMRDAFPEAEITGYQSLIPAMRNDPKDRHVAAAAIMAEAQVIVTENISNFQNLPGGLEAKTVDESLCDLFSLSPRLMAGTIVNQAAALRRPPRTPADILRGLDRFAPRFVTKVRPLVE